MRKSIVASKNMPKIIYDLDELTKPTSVEESLKKSESSDKKKVGPRERKA